MNSEHFLGLAIIIICLIFGALIENHAYTRGYRDGMAAARSRGKPGPTPAKETRHG